MRYLSYVLAALPAVSALKISGTGRCGASFGLTCSGSSYGNCCSQYGYCGTTSDHCKTGCQSDFGTCGSSAPSSAVAVPSAPAAAKVSKDGSCGGSKGYSCLNSGFGNCCSKNGWCGDSKDYCGTGCDSAFGSCSSTAPSSTRATTLLTVSTSASARPITSNAATCSPVTLTIFGKAVTATVAVTSVSIVTVPGNAVTSILTATQRTTLVTTITERTSITAVESTTVTVPTTVVIPGEESTTTVTVPGEDTTKTLTIPGEAATITVTIPGEDTTATITAPGEEITVTATVTGEASTSTLTIPGEEVTTTATISTCAPPNPTATEAVNNGGFESSFILSSNGWSINQGGFSYNYGSAADAHSGSQVLRFAAGSANKAEVTHSFAQSVALVPNGVYRLEFFSKANIVNNCQMRVTLGGTAFTFANPVLGESFEARTAMYYPVDGVSAATLSFITTCAQLANGQQRTVIHDDISLKLVGFYTAL